MSGKASSNLQQDRERLLRSAQVILEADQRMQRQASGKNISEADLKWAQDNNMPTAFFEFFTLEHAS
ncbi:MAG: hypothetical protein H6922_06280 [Pseudomonadaceae bacterium]|nr:hypothetical protein [Pseudomonadaceae bacterium]